ncbi:hypothetical protein [Halomonas sp. KO116]|uniref:hypothetical protein n=1 Tax=Halomonas sp. KO116 TaxID=1504981 RepID=UPI0004E30DBA|nr:hypothetical protein [Halomonas sp. KO116]AJY53198.1 hypothetical protein KO116_P200091 [Halomonas sp. KO116]
MTICPTKTELSQLVTAYGWLPASPFDLRHTGILATKDYDTAVGPKTASLWLSPAGAGQFRLAGNYCSEGRNVLSTVSGYCWESSSHHDLQATLEKVLSQIDQNVDQSYARRLLLGRSATS